MIIRIIIYGIVTIALVMLIRYQQERNEVQFQSPPTIHEIQFEDSLFLMEEPLE